MQLLRYMVIAFFIYCVVEVNAQIDNSTIAADSAHIFKILEAAKPLISTNPDSALVLLKSAVHQAHETSNPQFLPPLYNRMIRIYTGRSDLDSATLIGREAVKMARKYSPNRLVFSARYLGEAFHKSGQEDSALVYLLEAEDAKTNANSNSSIHLYILLDLLDVHQSLMDAEKMRHYRNRARTYLKKKSDLNIMDRIVVMHDLLIADLNLQDTVSFSHGLSEYQKLVKPFENFISMPEYHTEMFQFTTDSPKAWIQQLNSILPVHRALKKWDNMALTYLLLSHAMLKEGSQAKQVIPFIDSSLQIGRRHGLNYVIGPALLFKQQVHISESNYYDAYQTTNAFHQFQDSVNTLDLKKTIEELHIQYETKQKENQILEQEIALKQKERQRNLLLLGIGLLGILGIMLESWRRVKLKNSELSHLQLITEKDRKIAESRMQLMRAQMNPHFLFNSLNSIKHFILQKPKDDSAQYISDFSKLMRLNLQNSAEVLIPLDREIVFLKQYLHMEQMRFKDPFEVTWEIDENVDLEAYFFPPMLIQPYIENAIWHGLRYKKSKGKIDIKIYTISNDNIVCIIQDNGIGRAKSREIRASSISLKKSMGTQITEDRISMTNDLLNADIRVHTEDLYDAKGQPKGTRVTISIPRIQETGTH